MKRTSSGLTAVGAPNSLARKAEEYENAINKIMEFKGQTVAGIMKYFGDKERLEAFRDGASVAFDKVIYICELAKKSIEE